MFDVVCCNGRRDVVLVVVVTAASCFVVAISHGAWEQLQMVNAASD
jgi:hypothetical protein